MKIVFICGSLQQGHDGVGDYTRRLAGEIINNGHQVSILALYDNSVHKSVSEFQLANGNNIATLRIPVQLNSKQRFDEAKRWILEIEPDWISLQFVPFAFQPKGLPYRLGELLKGIGNGRNWHIMVHELWIGMHRNAPLKELAWSYLQRLTILRLIKTIQPRIIHTQSSLYKFQLGHFGYEADLLPLFSNIPRVETILDENNNDKLRFVLFGGIHNTNGPVSQFTKELKEYAIKLNKPVSLTILGRGGKEQKYWEQIWKDNDLDVIVLGEQSEEQISKILQASDYGITTTVYDKLEKSGSICAMIEHGLNVVCVAGPWKSRLNFKVEAQKSIYEYREGELEAFFDIGVEEQPDLLPQASSKLLTALSDKLNNNN